MTDSELLALVSAAFADAPRPEHFTHRECCDECRRYDDLFRSRTLGTLSAEDVRAGGPLTMMLPEGFRYYLPAFVRLALGDEDDGLFYDCLLSRLCQPIGKGGASVFPELELFSREEAAATHALLKHLRAKWPPAWAADDRKLTRGIRTWEAAAGR